MRNLLTVLLSAGLLMMGCSHQPKTTFKEGDTFVQFDGPYGHSPDVIPFRCRGSERIERHFQDSLAAAWQADSVRSWHYTETPPDLPRCFYVSRVDCFVRALPPDSPAFNAAKGIAKALCVLLNGRVEPRYYDQLYITFCKIPLLDTQRVYVFSKCKTAPADYPEPYTHNIGTNPNTPYLTTRMTYFNWPPNDKKRVHAPTP